MYNKTDIFNLALSALYLQKRIADSETDVSNETKVMQLHWKAAYYGALTDLDLDHAAKIAALALVQEDPDDFWDYAYSYPTDCVFIRRIISRNITDDTENFIDRKVGTYNGEKVIFTNESQAKLEYISSDVLPQDLSVEAAMYVAYKLASLSLPLIVGKDSEQTYKLLEVKKAQAYADAKAKDAKETNIYQAEWYRSEFAKTRLS